MEEIKFITYVMKILIPRGDVSDALAALLDKAYLEKHHVFFSQQLSRLNNINEQFNLGIIENKDKILEVNKLTYATLDKINKIKEEIIKKYDNRTIFNELSNHGNYLLRAGEFEYSIAFFDEALLYHPNNCIALIDKAIALDYLKRHEEAIKIFNEVIENEDRNVIAFFNRGIALFNSGRKSEACDDWNKVKNFNSDIADELIKNHCEISKP